MDESPQAVAGTTFRIVKKGYDPDEVRAYLSNVSRSLTAAQEHAASMEARARQAVAKAQELMQQRQATPERGMKLEDTETISRTLLLAQRTADNTTADARREAEKTLATARAEAETALAGAKQEALRVVEAARADARRAGENERVQVEEELQQLLARLEFLRDDVTQLDRFTGEQRTRLRETADALHDIAERPVGGLGEHRSPVLSAASDMPPPFGTPVAEGGLSFAGGDESGTASDPEAATQALDAMDQAEIDDLDLANGEHHDITAEVPVTPPAQGSDR
ncbi:MAG TPA: DivIVA domain-containing protein [Ilumatobacteraceae bacterium]|jgi:DivIVA domain-containing protein